MPTTPVGIIPSVPTSVPCGPFSITCQLQTDWSTTSICTPGHANATARNRLRNLQQQFDQQVPHIHCQSCPGIGPHSGPSPGVIYGVEKLDVNRAIAVYGVYQVRATQNRTINTTCI